MTFLFQQPAWLLTAIPAGWLWFRRPPPTRALRGLRAGVLLLTILAIARPAARLPARGGTIVAVVDRSASMPPESDAAARELIGAIHARLRGRDRLAVVAFGASAAVEQAPQISRFAGFAADVSRDGSDLAGALDAARRLIPPGESGRLLIVSDGEWTCRDPVEAAAALAARGVAADYRLLRRPAADDTAILDFRAPPRVLPRASFTIEATYEAPPGRAVAYALARDGRAIARGRATARAGRNRLVFRDRAPAEGILSYRLEIAAEGADPIPENNAARAITGVEAPRPALLVSAAGADSGLRAALEAAGLVVRAVSPEAAPDSLEALAAHAAVVLENTPASAFGAAGLERLAAWIEHAGGGLLMTGGRSSYGLGGYYRSPLERVLPVSLELRREHRKLNIAIAVALDRSGSMAMPAGLGRVKMDFANLGAAQVLDLLSPTDEIGVLAVDTVPHTIVEMDTVEVNVAARGKILRIDSQGCGIYVYEALQAALKMLLRARAVTKHVILFADAADAEEPGAYRELLAKARAAGVTCSVIGLGRPTDVDAGLLRDVARAGGGTCYFTADAGELPRLFAQDTFAVARNTFIEEETAFRWTGGLRALTPVAFADPPPLGGYNLCYARPGANVAAVTLDEYAAPVAAAWPAGAGRVVCFTGEADGAATKPFGRGPDAARFLGALGAWAAGVSAEGPEGLLVTHDLRDGLCAIEVHLDPERERTPFLAAPRARLLRGRPGAPPVAETAPLHWVSADRLALEVPLAGDETLLAAIEFDGGARTVLPPVCLPYSPEFRPVVPGRGAAALEAVAAATGGRERIDAAEIGRDLPRSARWAELTPILALAAAGLFLVEILQRRAGLPFRARNTAAPPSATPAAPAGRRARPPGKGAGAGSSAAPSEPAEAAESPPVESGDLAAALRRARRAADRRLRKPS